jgi:ADP-heptose:LPS heptosyltransferase
VAIIRLRSLGDCVLTTPALEILKRSRPDLAIGVVVEEPFAALFEGNPDVAALLRPDSREVAGFRPQLAVNFHGGTRSLWLTALSGARFRAGFGHFQFAFAYNVKIPRAQEILGVERKVHTAEHLASAMFHLGAPHGEIPAAKLFVEEPLPFRAPYAVIHPVASAPEKTWPPERFLAVARRLDMECIFIGGGNDDLGAFREFRTLAGAPLAEIKRLLKGATLFIGNDSGPAHMAAALDVPAVVIFGASDAEIWGPWKAPGRTLVARGPIASILEEEVLEAVEQMGAPV